jgi:molybdopterin molybdotransferase
VQHLLTVDGALAAILEHVVALPTEAVRVEASLGRVVREPVISRTGLPPFASSAMDGFALRASDTPGELPVAFRVAAGSPSADSLPPGAAAGVATGGVIPDGADAVVPVEDVVNIGERIEVPDAIAVGRNVRPRGGDVVAGDVVLTPGTIIRAPHVGALAAVGMGEVVCSVRPRVALLATGSELQSAGELLRPGGIYE